MKQLEEIREALHKGIEIKGYVNKELRGIALREIFLGLEWQNAGSAKSVRSEIQWICISRSKVLSIQRDVSFRNYFHRSRSY